MLWNGIKAPIYFAPDDGKGGGAAASTTDTPPETGGAPAAGEKTFTQAELDQIVKDRVAREKAKLSDATEAARKQAEAEAAAKNGEWQKLAEQREAELKRAAAELREERIRATAARLGLKDPDYGVYLVNKAGEGADPEVILKGYLDENPASQAAGAAAQTQAASGSQSASNPASAGGAFTREQLRDHKFFQANKEAILKAAAEGRIQE